MSSRAAVLVALPLLALAACGGDDEPAAGTAPPVSAPGTVAPAPSTTPAGDLAAELDGRTFLSTAVSGQTLVAGSQIRLDVDADHLGVSPGCNSAGGAWSLDGDVLVVGDMAMTEMACEPAALMDQDRWVVELLTSRPTLAVDEDTLTVTGGDVTITFTDREVADPDRPLEDTAWTLESIVTADSVSSVPAGTRTPTLAIAAGRLSVDTGCNTGGADVTVTAIDLTTAGIALTRMACADPAGQDVEAHIVAVLEGTATYSIEADVLTVMRGDQGLQYRAS
jgi:heat shock protein HslJ